MSWQPPFHFNDKLSQGNKVLAYFRPYWKSFKLYRMPVGVWWKGRHLRLWHLGHTKMLEDFWKCQAKTINYTYFRPYRKHCNNTSVHYRREFLTNGSFKQQFPTLCRVNRSQNSWTKLSNCGWTGAFIKEWTFIRLFAVS